MHLHTHTHPHAHTAGKESWTFLSFYSQFYTPYWILCPRWFRQEKHHLLASVMSELLLRTSFQGLSKVRILHINHHTWFFSYILSELSTETELITLCEQVLFSLSSSLSFKLLKWLSLWTSIDFFIWIKYSSLLVNQKCSLILLFIYAYWVCPYCRISSHVLETHMYLILYIQHLIFQSYLSLRVQIALIFAALEIPEPLKMSSWWQLMVFGYVGIPTAGVGWS